MRFAIDHFLVALVWAGSHVFAAEPEVHVVRDGYAAVVSRPERLVEKLCALTNSASVSSAVHGNAHTAWRQLLTSESHVRVLFPDSRTLSLKRQDGQASQPQRVYGMLLPLPTGRWPPGIYLYTDTALISVAKYSPAMLRELVLEPDLKLAAVKPYTQLLSIP